MPTKGLLRKVSWAFAIAGVLALIVGFGPFAYFWIACHLAYCDL